MAATRGSRRARQAKWRQRIARVWVAIGLALLAGSAATAEVTGEHCIASFRVCPSETGVDYTVPDKVLATSSRLGYCPVVFEGKPGEVLVPPTVVLIVDNSGSMDNLNKDPWALRYDISLDMINKIYRVRPDSRVSLVFFRAALCLYPEDYPQAVKLSPEYNDGYLPPLVLNQDYGGKSGIQILTEILEDKLYKCTDKPHGRVGDNMGTDISLAFEAARAALATVPANEPKESRFIVFLSDGKAGNMDDPYRQQHALDYIEGLGVPQTFTIWFGPDVHESLVEMTDNIKANGYSENNPNSELWGIDTVTYQRLSDIMDTTIVPSILEYEAVRPDTVSINRTVVTTSIDSGSLFFNEPYPLSSTRTDMDFTFKYTLLDTTDYTVEDTTLSAAISLVRQAGAALPSGMSLECWRDTLDVQHNGVSLNSITEDMDTFDVVLAIDGAAVGSATTVTVRSRRGGDEITATLIGSGGRYVARIPRRTAATQAGDAVLENAADDTIVVTWQNAAYTEDSLALQVPFVQYRGVTATGAWYRDIDADGLIDAVAVSLSGGLDPRERSGLASRVTLPAHRSLTVDSVTLGPDLLTLWTQSGNAAPSTAVDAVTDRVTIAAMQPVYDNFLAAGALAVADSLAPVVLEAHFVAETPSADLPRSGTSDTLEVVVSEAIDLTAMSDRPFVVQQGSSAETYTFLLTPLGSTGGSGYRFLVRATEGADIPMAGDSLWIGTPNRVADAAGVVQNNAANRRAQLSVSAPKVGAPVLTPPGAGKTSHEYFGRVSVTLDCATPGARIQFRIADGAWTMYDGAPFELDRAGTVTIEAFAVRQGYLPSDTTKVAFVNLDAEGPRVISALLFPGNQPGDNGPKRPDILRITFNEPVNGITGDSSSPPELFDYFMGGDQSRDFEDLFTNAVTVVAPDRVEIVAPLEGFRIRPGRDSIAIDAAGPVTDLYGNAPPPDGRTEIEWGVTYEWVPAALSPVTPGLTPIPPAIQSLPGIRATTGTVIMVNVLKPSTGTVTIYDVVGNVVLPTEDMIWDEEQSRLVIAWDGTNASGRTVGTGAYLAFVRVTDSDGETGSRRVKIGVAR